MKKIEFSPAQSRWLSAGLADKDDARQMLEHVAVSQRGYYASNGHLAYYWRAELLDEPPSSQPRAVTLQGDPRDFGMPDAWRVLDGESKVPLRYRINTFALRETVAAAQAFAELRYAVWRKQPAKERKKTSAPSKRGALLLRVGPYGIKTVPVGALHSIMSSEHTQQHADELEREVGLDAQYMLELLDTLDALTGGADHFDCGFGSSASPFIVRCDRPALVDATALIMPTRL